MYRDSREEALHSELVLAKILKKRRDSKSFLRASVLSRKWRTMAQIQDVVSGFCINNNPSFLGFILEHDRGIGTKIKLIYPPSTPNNRHAQSMRNRFVTYGLYDKYILGTNGGCVISHIDTGSKKGRMYRSCPYAYKPTSFKKMGRPITAMPKNEGDSTYGQFAVLPTTGLNGTSLPVVFIKDPSRLFDKNQDGVKFDPAGRVRVHVSVYENEGWVPHESDPLAIPSPVTFQRTPYCVQVGSRLYLMYLVGFIVCFDVERKKFGVVDLPTHLADTVIGCLQYTVGPHPEGELAIYHMNDGKLVKWVLVRKGEMAK